MHLACARAPAGRQAARNRTQTSPVPVVAWWGRGSRSHRHIECLLRCDAWRDLALLPHLTRLPARAHGGDHLHSTAVGQVRGRDNDHRQGVGKQKPLLSCHVAIRQPSRQRPQAMGVGVVDQKSPVPEEERTRRPQADPGRHPRARREGRDRAHRHILRQGGRKHVGDGKLALRHVQLEARRVQLPVGFGLLDFHLPPSDR
mmetsp:Transcript_148402/g.475028  ORF Transcript_148402/g.475028 Transcript_148402/m.475028 type:complete len:201 (+) Transcript_148402:40-642(+)